MYRSFQKTFNKYIETRRAPKNRDHYFDQFYVGLPLAEVYEWCKYAEAAAKEKSFRLGVNFGIVATTIIWLVVTLLSK